MDDPRSVLESIHHANDKQAMLRFLWMTNRQC